MRTFRQPSIFLALAAYSLATAAPLPTFRKVVLESQCADPMELAVLPDGRVLFIERFGNVRVWKPEGKTVLAAKLAVHGTFNPNTKKGPDQGSWEAGLIGLTLAPEFPQTGWVYLYYSPAGATPENRISRFTLTGDSLDLASEKVILRVPTQREVCCHEAGSLAFDSAGNLFLSTGDNTNPFQSDGYSPSDFRPGRYPFDAARTAANANDLRGKILRIHPESDGTYTIPAGNLFPPGTPNTKPEIFVMGCRNPFRLSVDPKTNTLSWGEVGPDAREINPERGPAGFDEINRTREAGNFGWPFVIADNKPYRRYDFATRVSGPPHDPAKPINQSPQNTGPRELPPARPAWLWYPYAPSTRFPETGSGGRTACAGPFYHFNPGLNSDRKLPEHYDGAQFIYEWERGWMMAVRADAQGHPLLEPFAPNIKLKRPVEMELGPDGALYVIEFGTAWESNRDSQLVRIEPTTAAETVVASAGAAPSPASTKRAPATLMTDLASIRAALAGDDVRKQQLALHSLGQLQSPEAEAEIAEWLRRVAEDNIPAALRLDVLDAAGQRKESAIQDPLRKHQDSRPGPEKLEHFTECLEGGDAERGRAVFTQKVEVSCSRCHRAGPAIQEGNVGPDLSKIGAQRDRRHLLEAIVLPNQFIVPGFEYLLIKMNSGKEFSGLLKQETDTELKLESPEDGSLTLKKAEIASRSRGLSTMPEAFKLVLTKSELRDLVEFLAGMK